MTEAARRDILLGIGAVAVTGFLAFIVIPLGVVLPGNTESRALAPDFWPTVILGMAALSGLCLIAHGWLRRTLGEDAARPTVAGKERLSVALRVAGAFGAMILCYLAIPFLGLVVPAVLLCLCLLLMGGERRLPVLLSVSLVLPTLLYLFFNNVAGVPIPVGVFEGLLQGSGA